MVNTAAIARDIEMNFNGTVSFDAILRAFRSYQVEEVADKHKAAGRKISKIHLKNRIAVISLKNSSEFQTAILRFYSESKLVAGETFRMVTSTDSASVTIDSKRLERFESFISNSQINRKIEDLAEIVGEMPIKTETVPSF